MAANGAANEPFPGRAGKPSSVTQKGFKITTQKLPISKAGPIEAMTDKLGIAPPEMIFGDNYVSVEHVASGWSIAFNAVDALDRVDKTGESMLQVAHSGEWQRSREHHHESIKEVVKPFDWSYSTDYKGTLLNSPTLFNAARSANSHTFTNSDPSNSHESSSSTASTNGSHSNSSTPTFQISPSTEIPLELLKRPDPITFFDEVVLYEDELADNGITMLSCKIRVMPDRLLLLCRFFLRLDNVLFRVRDTRVYVEFDTGEVIREYTVQEDGFEAARAKLVSVRDDIQALMRDSNRLAQILPLREKVTERLVLR